MSKVVEKKLGRQRAYGMVNNVDNPKGPILIEKAEKDLANFLWNNGYRKVIQ